MSLLGAALVVALVAIQPIALGFFPALGTTSRDSNGPANEEARAEAAGLGAGAGDMTAGALSSMLRDLNSKSTTGQGPVAAHTRSVSPVVLVQLPELDVRAALRAQASHARARAPATTRAGTSAHGYQLLL